MSDDLSDYDKIPTQIQEMAEEVRKFENARLSRSGGKADTKISKYRLKIAFWVCRNQNMPPNLENLIAILGPHFREASPFIAEVKKELGIT